MAKGKLHESIITASSLPIRKKYDNRVSKIKFSMKVFSNHIMLEKKITAKAFIITGILMLQGCCNTRTKIKREWNDLKRIKSLDDKICGMRDGGRKSERGTERRTNREI